MIELPYHRWTFRLVPERSRLIPSDCVMIRSLWGLVLRERFCLFRDRLCDTCSLRTNCGYGHIFETPKEGDTQKRMEHPYRLSFDGTDLVVTLFGKGGETFKDIVRPVVAEMGQRGVGPKDRRIRFNTFCTSVDCGVFQFSDDSTPSDRFSDILVSFNSPVRIQRDGRMTSNIDVDLLFRTIWRRTMALCRAYGSISETGMRYTVPDACVSLISLDWVDWDHYSQRQRESMKLGGAEGVVVMHGRWSPRDLSLLDFATLAGCGKATSFGLGSMSWYKVVEKGEE